jgi:hypothetical protein
LPVREAINRHHTRKVVPDRDQTCHRPFRRHGCKLLGVVEHCLPVRFLLSISGVHGQIVDIDDKVAHVEFSCTLIAW